MAEPTLTTRFLGDENLLALIMENVDNPQTLFNLVLVLPNGKATFERCPKQLLTAVLSNLPSEIKLLAILYVILTQDHVTRASMIPILWDYLRLDETPGRVVPVTTVSLNIPANFSNPFGTLRKLAAVWSAVEGLASGYVECSINFIQSCKAAEAARVEKMPYQHGHKVQPLSHLWNRDTLMNGVFEYRNSDKPQPWSLPLRAAEIHRVKRALWRLEIIAAVSHEPYAFPNDGAIDSGATEVYRADPLDAPAIQDDDEEGTRMLLASLEESELAELESIYNYLWSETIGKVYQHKIDPYLPHEPEPSEHAEAKRRPTLSDFERSQSNHAEFEAQFTAKIRAYRAREDYNRYLTYLMSLGLPFLHRVHRQLTRDGGEVSPHRYPPLRYRSLTGLRDTWSRMDESRLDDTNNNSDRYTQLLRHTKGGYSIRRKPRTLLTCSYTFWFMAPRACNHFSLEELWRAGCYMWDKRSGGSSYDSGNRQRVY